jgi:hypothetical protein
METTGDLCVTRLTLRGGATPSATRMIVTKERLLT